MSRLADWYARQQERAPRAIEARDFGAIGVGRTDGNGAPIVEFSPEVDAALRLASGGISLNDVYRSQWAVRTVVNFLALNIAHLNLKVFMQLGDLQREQRDHPLAQLLNRPNPFTTRFDLIRGTVSDLAIYDNAFWLKTFIGNTRTLHRIPPAFCQPRGGNIITGPRRYRVTGGGDVERFYDPSEIVHFHGYNPLDTRVGSSPLDSLRHVLNEEVEAAQHRAGFWKNAARRDGIIRRPRPDAGQDDWSPQARERFKAEWRNRYTGANNAGTTPILEDDMDWIDDSFSPKDSEFIAGRQFGLDTVATTYLIPLALLSRTESSTFASLREYHTMMYVDTLGPWDASIEGTLKAQLIPDFGDTDLFCEFNIDEKLQGDFETQSEAIQRSVQVPWMSVNQALKLRGLPPIPSPRFDVPARSVGYLYGDETKDAPAAPRRSDQAPEPADPDQRPLRRVAQTNGYDVLAAEDAADVAALTKVLEDA